MLVSKHIYNYLCEINEKFNNIKIQNNNIITFKQIEIINNDIEMKMIWEETIKNIDTIYKYIKDNIKENTKENKKKYCREYYKKHYNENEVYREKKKKYNKMKYKQSKIILTS